MGMETEGKELLWRRLDESLRRHAKALGGGDGLPDIADIYRVQEMAEVHCYLKTEHPFTPMEVNALLQFADPLEVAVACWEQNPDKYALDICKILYANDMFQDFAPAEAETERTEKPSLRGQLHAAMDEARRQARRETAEAQRGAEPR